MLPPAPARFSITKGCLRISSIFLVRMRAITSLGPPGAKPIISVLYLNPSVPAASLGELIAHAKANPGTLSFGSGGNGTPAHLAGELLKLEAKIDITHVPFRGTGPALQAVIGGHVPMAFNPPSPLLPHIQSGTIRALAITTLKRTAVLPEVPTIAESGFPGFEATTWH